MTTSPSASSIINRSNAAHDDVHSYALEQINVLRTLLDKAEAEIIAKKEAASAAVAAYIDSVDETLRAARPIEDAIGKLIASIPGPPALQQRETEV